MRVASESRLGWHLWLDGAVNRPADCGLLWSR